MLRWWEGWGGVGHVNVMLMVRWCYVDGRGGVGVGHVNVMFMVRWCYVDGRGGVGHVNVMFMVRWCYVDGWGGVGWGMLTSCSWYVDATLMGGVGWGGHVNVMFDFGHTWFHWTQELAGTQCWQPWQKFRELSMSSLQPASKVWDRAPWTLWKRTCCSMCKRMLTLKLQHVPFHANIQKIANTYFFKKNLPSYYTTIRSKNWQFLLKKHKRLSWHVLFRVGKQEKIEKEHVAAGCWSWSNKKPKKGWLSTFAVSCER